MANFNFCRTPVETPPVKTAFRKIVTPIPVPQSIPILDTLYRYESRSMHGQMPIVWDRAKDFQVFDKWGNCWIDFTSTIFVANAGHANENIVKALKETLDQGLLHTYTYASEIRARFLQELIQATPDELEKAYLVSAGTEASETVVKLMRLYAGARGKRRPGVIAFDGSFHGRTMGAAQISGNQKQRDWIGFEDPNVHHLPFPYPWHENGNRFERDIESLRRQGIDPARDIGGIMFESYIGWSAAFFPRDYVLDWAELAQKHDFLVAFDEIQSGFGRTGRMFAYQHYGVRPDLICCGKGISSSLPLAAVLGRADVMDLPDIGSMSSTHSANPMSCAAGLANLAVIRGEDLVGQSAAKGKLLHQRLERLRQRYGDYISHILGKGMLAGLIITDPVAEDGGGMLASKICESALRKGLLLVHTGRESIKIGPPLTIPEEALMEGLDVVDEAIAETLAGRTR